METIGKKPVIYTPKGKVLNLTSGFQFKQLCDGPTFTLGYACAYSCAFCYVDAQMKFHPKVIEAKESLGKNFQEIVIRRSNGLDSLRSALLDTKGNPKYIEDNRVIFSSPLVDIGGNIDMAKETVEACKIILELTGWSIRLLTKSNLLPFIAEKIDPKYKSRLIFGVSTGTLDDNLGAAFELGTARVSKRIRSIHQLQDAGWRTYGMICPSLPHKDYGSFSSDLCAALRIDKMEHVWAEVINVRGESMTRTCKALMDAGFSSEATHLAQVSSSDIAWEEYARETYLAHSANIPPNKLRFLQYVNNNTRNWWKDKPGVVVLGS